LVAPFSLTDHQVIVPDQRGAGVSRPRGRTAGNHTDQLVADLEVLRQHLGLARWSVLAGSWGTVLALRYAQCHPERVSRLVLRGAFALRRAEIGGVLQPQPGRDRVVWGEAHWPRVGPARAPVMWARLAQLLQFATLGVATLRVVRCWNLLEQRAALRGLWRSLLHASQVGQSVVDGSPAAQRQAWAQLRRQHRRASAGLQRSGVGPADRRGLQKFRLQAHYLRHRGFMAPGGLDAAVRSVALHATPTDWVHGCFDSICPTHNSRRWLGQSDAVAPGLAQGHWPDAGHLASEPAMQSALARVVCLARGKP
jgi:proline iminopeptidase